MTIFQLVFGCCVVTVFLLEVFKMLYTAFYYDSKKQRKKYLSSFNDNFRITFVAKVVGTKYIMSPPTQKMGGAS